jgi:hypothetical protein
MYIRRFSIGNYKCFSGQVSADFQPGLNVIAGGNNSGKTALLEGITLEPLSKPHRSLAATAQGPCLARIDLSVTLDEYRTMSSSFPLVIVAPAPDSEFAREIGCGTLAGTQQDRSAAFRSWIESQSSLRLVCESNNGQWNDWKALPLDEYPFDKDHATWGINLNSPGATVNISKQAAPRQPGAVSPVRGAIMRNVYFFRASRLPNLGESTYGQTEDLLPDGRNPTGVLDLLQRNRARFDRWAKLVSEVSSGD